VSSGKRGPRCAGSRCRRTQTNDPRESHTCSEQPRRAKTVVVFVDFDVSRDPKACRVGQKLIGLRQFEEARPAEWKVHIAHRLERHAHEQFQRCPVWLDESITAG
jgi:hypothetical protein